MLHKTISRRGGKASSERKTQANRAKAAAYWEKVQSGTMVGPKRHRRPPDAETIAKMLTPYCRDHGIIRLEVFGSVARGEARQGSDVDLIATFDPARMPRGLRFFAVPDEMELILGVPVDVLTPEGIADMTNPFRKNAILAEAREILSL